MKYKIVSTSEGNTHILNWNHMDKKALIKYVQQLSQLASNGDDSAKAEIIKIYNSYKKEVEKIESEMAEAPIQKSKVKQLIKSLIMIMPLGVLKIDSIDKGYKQEYDDWIKQLVSMYDQERDQEKLIKCYEQIGLVETGSITEEYKGQYVKWIKDLVNKHDQEVEPAKHIEYYEKLEKAGEQEYQYKLGMLYAEGPKEVQDIDKAIDWLKKSKANHIEGASDALNKWLKINCNFKLGRKKVSEGDLAEAMKFYQQASEGGHHKSTNYKQAIEQNTQEVTSLIEAVKSK